MITMDSSARKWVYGTCAVIANALLVLLVLWAETLDANWKPLLWGIMALGALVGFFVATSRTGAVGAILPGAIALAAGLLAAGSLLSVGVGKEAIATANVPYVGYVVLYLSIGALAGALLGVFFRNIITHATQTEHQITQLRQQVALQRAQHEQSIQHELASLQKAEVEVARRFPTLRRKQIDLVKRIVDMNRARATLIAGQDQLLAGFEARRLAAASRIVEWLGTVPPQQWTEVHSKTLATLMAFQPHLPLIEAPKITEQPAVLGGNAESALISGEGKPGELETLLMMEGTNTELPS